jgi:CubicO group peptidase (beta-lactamase class C family)
VGSDQGPARSHDATATIGEQARPARDVKAAVRLAVVAALLGALLLPSACGPRTAGEPPPRGLIYLSPDGHGDYASLNQAVRQAPEGATIVLAAGVYRLPAPLDIYRSVTLRGAGPDQTIVIGTTAGHVLGFSGNGAFSAEGLTFRHVSVGPESNPSDVALFRGGTVELSDCRFAAATLGENAAGFQGGAGVRLLGDTRARMRACSAEDNAQAGVVCEPHARPILEKVTFSRNGRPGLFVVPGRTGPTDPAELTNFLDATMPGLLGSWRVPGAVVVVVKDGRVLAQRGYGFADVVGRKVPDPARTLFRVASVTKLFTATAVLQLAEQGKLRLGVDAQMYLPGVTVPRTFARPVTVADLLSHTSGFDERTIGMAAPNAALAPPLDRFLVREMPSRVVPAGLFYSYSNYNYGLAGAVVQAAGGMPYEKYITQKILAPLGMTDTSFDPRTVANASLAPGYRYRNGGYTALSQDIFADTAAGQLYSTGADMARFMLCELQGGQLDGTRILGARWMERMLAPRFDESPQLPASGYAYVEQPIDNRRPVEQAGDWNGYASLVFLLPQDGLGIFVAVNSDQGQLRDQLIQNFMDHYYPDRDRLFGVQPAASLSTGLTQFAGTYRTLRMAHAALDKWLAFSPDSDLIVDADQSNAVTIHDTRYVQVQPLVFLEQYGDSYAVFQRGRQGGVDFLTQGTTTYQRLHWYETYIFQRRLVIFFVYILGLTAVAWLLTPFLGRLRRRLPLLRHLGWRRPPGYLEPAVAQTARAVAGLAALLDLAFLATADRLITTANLVNGVPGGVTALLVVPLLATALSAAMPVFAGIAWARRYWGVFGRLSFTFVTLIAALFIWFLAYWNLLGFRY